MPNARNCGDDGDMTQPGLMRPEHQTRPSNVPDGVLTTERRQDRLIAGVCSGLAARYNIDPLLVRVAFVLLGLSLGVGVVLYAFCAVWMVEEGSSEPLIHQQVPSSRNWAWLWVMVGLVAISIATMVAAGGILPFGPMPAIILLGVWLWARHARRTIENRPMVYFPASAQYAAQGQYSPQAQYSPGGQNPQVAQSAPGAKHQQQPLTQFDAASMAWRSRLESVYLSNDPLPPTPPQPMPVLDVYGPAPETVVGEAAAVPARTRTRRSSWAATVWMWLAALIAFVAVHLAGPEGQYGWMLPAAVALGVVGLFLLVGAFTRRPHLAILTGLVVVLTMFSSLGAPYLEPLGPSGTHAYTATAPVPEQVDIRYRSTTLDFSKVELTRDQTITVNATASSVVVLPSSSTLIEYQLEAGVINHQGTEHGGAGESGTIDLRNPGQPTLTIKVLARAAEVIIP